ncbi:MAG: putative phosphoglycerate mutase family protein [Fibrobacteres bacterium]|nr:putative phosphoglycerate mutase family protein [Fibrobacterota bacterium]
MKLGIVRHFQIPHDRMQMVDGPGFDEWAVWYDTTEVHAKEVPAAGQEWDHCLCSDLPRAMFTAKTIFKGNIEVTPLLREVPFTSFLPRRLTLPLLLWQATSRLGWYLDHASQRENRTQTKRRIAEFVAKLKADHRDRNVLIVTHGFFMQWLEKELVLAGFRGKVPTRPLGGTIYLFQS